MARLTEIYRAEDYVNIGRRQIPLSAGDNLMMLMDLNSKGLAIDSPQIRGKELEEFTRKYNLLTGDELRECLEVDSTQFTAVLNQCVQCVGCRRRVERLFYQLTLSGHPTIDPLMLRSSHGLTIADEKLKSPQALGTILYRHHEVLNNLLENKLRNKTRCVLHSLDAFRSKPFSETWREVWSSMKHNCRDELAVIETKELHEVLESYLKKHKFCQGCRTKIEKAYKILVGETTAKEKGFVAALYANIKKCHPDKHIHVYTNKIDFLDALIRRAEPEVNGSYSKQRERHAKTLEIAQEEVLTCIGMIMYERLRRIYVSLREEERACQVLAAVGVHALCIGFDLFVERKQGISNLELLYQEMSRADKAKQYKREQKKLKKKKKKNEKKNSCRSCEQREGDVMDADAEDDGDQDGDGEGDDEQEDEAVDVCADNEVDDDDEVEDHVVSEDGSGGCVLQTPASLSPQSVQLETDFDVAGGNIKRKKKLPKQQKLKQKPPQQAQNKKNRKKRHHQPKQTANATNGSTTTRSSSSSCSPPPLIDVVAVGVPIVKCNDCLAPSADCPCDVKDSGYGSEPNYSQDNSRISSAVSSPEGSEVSCSDGFCNHDEQHDPVQHFESDHFDARRCQQQLHHEMRHKLSLQQMLDELDECDADADDDDCYIPPEVVLEYQCQHEHVQQQRLQLRETLRLNFERLCMERGVRIPL